MDQVFTFLTDPLNYGTEPASTSPVEPPFLAKKPTHSQDSQPYGLTPLESKIKNLILSAYSAEEPGSSQQQRVGPPLSSSSGVVTSSAPSTPSTDTSGVKRHPSTSSSNPPSPPLHLIPVKAMSLTDQQRVTLVPSDRAGANSILHKPEEFSSTNSLTDTGLYPPVLQPPPPPSPSPPRSSSSQGTSAGEPNLPVALRYSSTSSLPITDTLSLSSPPVFSMVYSPVDSVVASKYKPQPQVSSSLMKHFMPPSAGDHLNTSVEYPPPSPHGTQSSNGKSASRTPSPHSSIDGDVTPVSTSSQSTPATSRESSLPPVVPQIPSHIQVTNRPLTLWQTQQPVPPPPRSSSSMTLHSTPPGTPTLPVNNKGVFLSWSSLHEAAAKPSTTGQSVSEDKFPGKIVRTFSAGNTPLSTPLPDFSHADLVPFPIHASSSQKSSKHKKAANDSTAASDSVNTKEVDSLRKQLQRAGEEKAHLEGKLDSVVAECRSTLKDRANLQARLARAETELKSYKERPELHVAAKQTKKLDEVTDELSEVSRLESTLTQKRRELAVLHKEVDREKGKVKQLESDLANARHQSAAKDDQIKELQSTNASVRQEVDQKADEVHEMDRKVATLQASIQSTESAKSWLHDQLQDALDSKVKLQEDLRASKAASIAQSIKIDQLQKENTLFRKQVGDLQNSVFQEKAQLVSELEAIEEDVARNEHSYAEMEDNKAQLEQLLALKTNELERLSSEFAQLEAAKIVNDEKLLDSQKSNELLQTQLKKTEREREKHLSESQQARQLLQMREQEVAELRKNKSELQNKLKQAETAFVSKQGELQGLKDSRDITKHELEAVQQARRSADADLASAAGKISKLQDTLAAAKGRCLALESQRQELESSLQDSKLAAEKLLSELKEKTRELAERDQAVGKLQNQSQDLQTQFGSLQAKFRSITDNSSKVQKSIEEKDSLIQQLQEQGDQAISELESEQESLVARIQELQAENSRLQGHLESPSGPTLEEYQRVIQDKARLDGELSSVKVSHQHKMIKAEAKAHRLETELKDLKREARRNDRQLQSQLDSAQQQIEKLREALAKSEARLKELNLGLQDGTDEKAALQAVMAAKEEQLHHLSERVEELENENRDLRDQLEETMNHLMEVEQACSVESEQVSQAAVLAERELKEEIQKISQEKERYKGQLEGVSTIQNCMREHVEALESSLAQKDSALTQLSLETNSLLQEKDEEIEDLREGINNTQEELLSVKGELERALANALLEKQRADELDCRLAEKDSAILERESASLKQELDDAREHQARLAGTNDDLQIELRTLKQQLAITQTTQESITRELQEKTAQVGVLYQELRLARDQQVQLQEELQQQMDHARLAEEQYQNECRPLMNALTDSNPSSFTGDTVDSAGQDSVNGATGSRNNGEISALRSELTSKSKALSNIHSCLSNLKQDMNRMQHSMDGHSVSLLHSFHSSRELENKIEDLRHSRTHSPRPYPTSSTPTST